MRFIFLVIALFFLMDSSVAQDYRKTDRQANLKASVHFANLRNNNYAPVLSALQDYPDPASGYETLKEELDKHWGERNLNQPLKKKTRGSAVAPIVLKEWKGNTTFSNPPDNDIALSNGGVILSAINSQLSIFNTNGDTLLLDWALQSVDSAIGVFTYISDPRLLYDPNTDRFVLVCFSGSNSTSSTIIVAFSQSNDPAANWNVYTLSGDPFGDNVWSDYPIIALNDKDLFMTFNHIQDNTSWQNGFRQSVIYQIKKSDGFAGNNLNYTIWDSLKFNGVLYRNICPAKYQEANMPDDMYFLSVRNVATSNDSVFLLHINNSYQSGTAAFSQQHLTSPVVYGMPPNARQDASQKLMTNDGRILAAIYENDRIHFGGNSIDPLSQAGLFLGEIRDVSTSPFVLADIIYDTLREFGYPSMTYVGTSATDHKIMYTFSHCIRWGFPGYSMMYKDPGGNYSDIIPIIEGTGYVDRVLTSNERWGDYSGVQKKYDEPSKCVMAGTYGIPNRLETWIAYIEQKDWPAQLQELEGKRLHTIYPNPVSNRFTAQFHILSKQEADFYIYDMNGQVVKHLLHHTCKPGLNEFSFNLDPLTPGFYLFKVHGSQGESYTERIIKE